MKKVSIDKKTLKRIIRDINKASVIFDEIGWGFLWGFSDEELTRYSNAEWRLKKSIKKLKNYQKN